MEPETTTITHYELRWNAEYLWHLWNVTDDKGVPDMYWFSGKGLAERSARGYCRNHAPCSLTVMTMTGKPEGGKRGRGTDYP